MGIPTTFHVIRHRMNAAWLYKGHKHKHHSALLKDLTSKLRETSINISNIFRLSNGYVMN